LSGKKEQDSSWSSAGNAKVFLEKWIIRIYRRRSSLYAAQYFFFLEMYTTAEFCRPGINHHHHREGAKAVKHSHLSFCLLALILILSITAGCGGGSTSSPGWYGGNDGAPATSAPQVTAVNPSQVTSGTLITITGTGFGTDRESRDNQKSTVSFLDSSGESTSTSACPAWSSTSIHTVVPLLSEGGTYTVVVNMATASGTASSPSTPSPSNTITITIPIARPILTSIAQSSASPGSMILLNGLNFGATQGTSHVAFMTSDGELIQEQAASWNDNEIQCLVPASITDDSVDVYVHTDAGGDSGSIELFIDEVPTTGTLTGTVYEAGTSTPLQGVQVSMGQIHAQSAATGTFTLEGVPAGSGLTITAEKSGYSNYQGTVNVSEGSTTTVTIYLDKVPPAAGSARGTVTDSVTGRPVAGARVTVQALSAFTDETGSYLLNGVTPGTGIAISASRRGYQDYSSTLDVSAGASTEKNFTMTTNSGSVYGTVTGSDGAKLAGIRVQAGRLDTLTGQDGTYQIDGISVSGSETRTITAWDPNRHYRNYSGTVELAVGTSTQHDFVMQKNEATTTGTLRGTVQNSSGKPIDGALLTVTGTGTYTTHSHAGRYEISGIKPGTVTVKAEAAGYVTQTKPVDIAASSTATLSFTMEAMRMVDIPGGIFTMGDVTGYWSTHGYDNEVPLTKVTLSAFSMGRYDVTNREYCAFLNDQGNKVEGGYPWLKAECPGITGTGPYTVVPGYENQPVVEVSWYGVVAYCNWLSDKEGLAKCYGDYTADGSGRWGDRGANFSRTAKGYRLATNGEWEYACRAGSTTDFFWGENYDPTVPGSPLQVSKYCWWAGNCGTIKDVGLLLPNAFGLYDMNGNVWEWVNDYNQRYSGESVTDPIGPTEATGMGTRICRGGGFYGDPKDGRSANFAGNIPSGGASIGFRVVRTR
jgi:formylglycine-generating enzyme required for sulfatase activity